MTDDTWYHRAQELEAECARPRAELAALANRVEKALSEGAKRREERDAALAKAAKLRAALEPFRELCAKIPAQAPDDAMLVLTTLNGGFVDTTHTIRLGDLRRARAVLAETGGGDGEN